MKQQYQVVEYIPAKTIKDQGVISRETIAGMLGQGRLMSSAMVRKDLGGYRIDWPHGLGASLILPVNGGE